MSESTSPARLLHFFVVAVVCFGIGVVASFLIILLSGFFFAGPYGDKWVVWFFGNNGAPFIALALILAAFAYPRLVKAKLRLFF